jgi:hypothetical protein
MVSSLLGVLRIMVSRTQHLAQFGDARRDQTTFRLAA